MLFAGKRRTAALCMIEPTTFRPRMGGSGGNSLGGRTVVASVDNSAVVSGAGSLTFGGIMGVCCGRFARVLGETAAVAIGAMFVIFQLACLKGYAEVKWDAIEKDVMYLLDRNHDGKVDRHDASHALRSTTRVFTSNMGASAAGFTGGFLLGLKR
eukprot:CAMPEP_0185844176 /NCGR_PEP_ID=MMETSP1354-20130828/437_1 /TAXON_ID=708628 /ORGANISM="Erythrolobus madagascarensis, Strain CCMP3276" /LENGTH=154 /DNA_ID=CAMNT_0028543797 /DNA_START=27 /DNA_END=491 /DNA_ORIENTATION=-